MLLEHNHVEDGFIITVNLYMNLTTNDIKLTVYDITKK